MVSKLTVGSGARHGTIFIPDISGFTKFINDTEIGHSQHIIAELLDLIIEETGTYFEISEIEGDAILFYRYGEIVDFDFLISLCERIFMKFHEHLKYYNRDKICHCGACSSAEILSLKFILHFGVISSYTVADRLKLLGKDIILAHRLLKNSIPHHEYILITEPTLAVAGKKGSLLPGFESGEESYDEQLHFRFWYKYLEELRLQVPEPKPREVVDIPSLEIQDSIEIQSDLSEVLSALTEPERRLNWVKNLQKIELKEHRINRVKTSHECLIGGNHVEITVEDLIQTETEIKLIERAKMKFPALEFVVLYHISKTSEQQVLLGMGNHFQEEESKWYLRLVFPVVRLMFKFQNRTNLKRLKEYLESDN